MLCPLSYWGVGGIVPDCQLIGGEAEELEGVGVGCFSNVTEMLRSPLTLLMVTVLAAPYELPFESETLAIRYPEFGVMVNVTLSPSGTWVPSGETYPPEGSFT